MRTVIRTFKIVTRFLQIILKRYREIYVSAVLACVCVCELELMSAAMADYCGVISCRQRLGYVVLCRLYFQEELAASEAKLSDQLHQDVDKEHHISSIEQNEKFNQQSAALRSLNKSTA